MNYGIICTANYFYKINACLQIYFNIWKTINFISFIYVVCQGQNIIFSDIGLCLIPNFRFQMQADYLPMPRCPDLVGMIPRLFNNRPRPLSGNTPIMRAGGKCLKTSKGLMRCALVEYLRACVYAF